jgi:hypothetical protein
MRPLWLLAGVAAGGDLMKIMRAFSKIHGGMPTRARRTLVAEPRSGSVIQTALERKWPGRNPSSLISGSVLKSRCTF